MSIPKHKKKRASRIFFAAFVTLALAMTSLYVLRHALAEEYRTIPSPDGHYRVVVYLYPVLFSMPGGSGDAPGFVRLYDSRGSVLGEAGVEMVQLVDQVYWGEGKVDIKLVAEWQLPR